MADDFPIRRILRNMAWERAKGEIEALMATFVDELDNYEEMRKAADAFIAKVEYYELAS